MRKTITDTFWQQKMELVRTKMIPYQWEVLNDRVADASPSYCIRNFRIAAKVNREKKEKGNDFQHIKSILNGVCVWPKDPNHLEDTFYGFVFQDSDLAKWIEAAAYTLAWHPDPELEKTIDSAVDLICEAQAEDGYLDTFYIINGLEERFTNLKDHHELYCFGHMTEAAVAYYEATGKRKLMDAICRYADCIAAHIGREEGKLRGYPGHEIAEMALVRLYEATGEKKYLELGQYFIDERGQRSYYFDYETGNQGDALRYHYYQSHLPVREQREAVGHAVRAVYLYSGMADYARMTGDEELLSACRDLWRDIVEKKMYLTGGIGATHIGESFSFAYDLPNDTAYAETCASIGMMFFARRMLRLEAKGEYADIMERELFNGVISGMDLSGTRFYYVNPLEVYPKACHEDLRKEHVKPVRQKWFGCACCPPNLARLIGSLDSYAVTREEKEPIFLHLLTGGEYEFDLFSPDEATNSASSIEGLAKGYLGEANKNAKLKITVTSALPYSGKVSMRITGDGVSEQTIAIRIPGWSEGYQCSLNNRVISKAGPCDSGEIGAAGSEEEAFTKNGYLYITRSWSDDLLEFDFPMTIEILEADTRVRENIGKAALMRGPLVYCLEEADNGSDLHLIQMDSDSEYRSEEADIMGEKVTVIKAMGYREKKREAGGLYHRYGKVEKEKVELTWIPYYVWANRGEGEMQVWTRI